MIKSAMVAMQDKQENETGRHEYWFWCYYESW